MASDSKNTKEELAENVEFCPYCSSELLEKVNEVDMYCMDCGRDFRIMTQD